MFFYIFFPSKCHNCSPRSSSCSSTRRRSPHGCGTSRSIPSFPPPRAVRPPRPVGSFQRPSQPQPPAGAASQNPQPVQQRQRRSSSRTQRADRPPAAAALQQHGPGAHPECTSPSHGRPTSRVAGLRPPNRTNAGGTGPQSPPHRYFKHQFRQPERAESSGHTPSERTVSDPAGERCCSRSRRSAGRAEAGPQHGPGTTHVHLPPTLLTSAEAFLLTGTARSLKMDTTSFPLFGDFTSCTCS